MASFYDLPDVLQEKIFQMKHRLEMPNILEQLKHHQSCYLQTLKNMDSLRQEFYRDFICITTFTKTYNQFEKQITSMPFKPFLFLQRTDLAHLIDRTINKPTHPNFAFSRLQMPIRGTVAPSKQGALINLRKKDLVSLCNDNDISYKTRDTKKVLAKKLMSI
tara:strand:+ start:53 stop:538 length:486 start_codon:yes stop_codon:yes gene_type:complete